MLWLSGVTLSPADGRTTLRTRISNPLCWPEEAKRRYRLDSLKPLVIGELVNRCNTVPMAFGRAYCIRHRLPDHIGSKEIVPKWSASNQLQRGLLRPRNRMRRLQHQGDIQPGENQTAAGSIPELLGRWPKRPHLYSMVSGGKTPPCWNAPISIST